ncbi:MAG: right-handed parallel beta-helix repeat-containing protein, partial [Cyclobacteriaceae bacterium]
MKNTNSISINTLITTFLFISILPFSFFCSGQTIHTADNNPGAIGGVNIYTGATALTDAIAAATAGDIIHVVRGANDYGATVVDKQLSIFGIGLNADTDGGELSIVSGITIADPVASGTRISGLNITNQLALGGVAGSLNNLLIENSRIRWIQHASATTTISSMIIRNNVIGSGFSTNEEEIDLLAGAISNITIANNVLYVTSSIGNHGVITASNGTSVENNLFVGIGNAAYFAFENFDGNTVTNNIFYGLRPWAIGSFTNNTFTNNISFGTGADGFSTSGGNTSTANLTTQDPLLLNVPLAATIDFSTFDPTLDTGSPALGSGTSGTDMGVFGGGSPMTLEGTLIPTIQTVTLPSIVVKGDNLPVQIKAKGN